ncbi:unnamed protein product [Rotaria socialis]|uniref:Fibronectin type-III domain-containing protein n=2 Tax=Rotaria socialis TaxID=392032 RepID=A0A820DVV7_9BILA|nr:unnamed protein product [Rotaria socialis]
MASSESHRLNDSIQSDDDDADMTYVIDITNGSFPEQMPDRIDSGDTVEFKTDKTDEYDIFQVYKDENDYYRIHNGFELYNINNTTRKRNRRISLSLALHQPKIELYFCIILSSKRQVVFKSRKCSVENCEKNCLIVHKSDIKFTLSDEKESQKLILHKGDTIELEWSSKRGNGYRIEEKKYCPISGGLYTVEQPSELTISRPQPKGCFRKTFTEFGTSFLFRLTDTNRIHDIIACIVKSKFKVSYIDITNDNIQPNIISIEQHDSIIFQWNTTEKQSVQQIQPFTVDQTNQTSIEMKTVGKDFFWPNEPSSRGYMIHRFDETGIFCFKTATNQIGTIVVAPKINIHSFPIFGDQLILKMNTYDFIQFEWKMSESEDDPLLITIDANSSVVPDTAGGLTGIFDCSMHKCVKVEPFFRQYFHTCEAFVLNIPQHGLYNFAYSDSRDDVLLSTIVESTVTNHRVTSNERNTFEPHTLVINRNDQVWFNSRSKNLVNIHRTDEYGNYLDVNKPIFQPQLNSVNCFMQQFQQTGIYYFSTDAVLDQEKKASKSPPLAIVVLPEIRFHYKLIRSSDFDPDAIITNINDFVVWQFEQIIRYGLIQLRANETLEDLVSCHDRAVAGRNRQCLAVECIMLGTFFFANPEFERVSGSDEDRLISTIIIDPPFSKTCFLIANDDFSPNVLYVAQNNTVSWILSSADQYHRISVESDDNKRRINEDNLIDRSIEQYVNDMHHLYTFEQCGKFTIRSNRFTNTATVIVYSDDIIRNQKKQLVKPQLIEDIDIVSQYGTQIHLKCPSQEATVYYTLDGSIPTRPFKNVHTYNSNTGIPFIQTGLHVLRAYATENEKLSSAIITSSPTFVMESEELAALNELRAIWKNTNIMITASIQYPNKLFVKIEVDPISSTDLIDHFELYVDDVAQRVNLAPTDAQFSAEGFAGGEQYEIHVMAFPKENLTDTEPISSNKRAFEIKREIVGGAPLISLAVSNEENIIFLMWAHIGDHISQYVVYVDNIETRTINEKDFNDFFGIQFHGAQQRKKYLIHVEALVKDTNEIRKSNVIAVNPPMEMPLKEQLIDRYFAYITVNTESPPSDMRVEIIHLDHFDERRPEPQRKFESLPITYGLRNAVPIISFDLIGEGGTLSWMKQAPSIAEFVENYRIMVDGEQYGEVISPDDEPKVQMKLRPGEHECYLLVLPKEKDQEVYLSNILKFNVPIVLKKIEPEEIPIPKLSVERVSTFSIRIKWGLDRPLPAEPCITMYEVHIRGQQFSDKIKSDENFQQDDYIEHIWHVSSSPLEIKDIPDRFDYIVFVRALFTIEKSTDTEYFSKSSELKVDRVIPLIDLLPRPVLKVIRIGLQMATVSWKFDDSVNQSLIKGYRIILNGKAAEILPPKKYEYELQNIKSGTRNDIQVSVTCYPDFLEEKLSESVHIICPRRPQQLTVESFQTEKPFSIGIKWKIDQNINDEITYFKVFLNGKLHCEIDPNGRHSFKHEFTKLKIDQIYLINVKAFVEHRKLDDYAYQCEIESNSSNELLLKCIAPPIGAPPRIERMYPNGIDITWEPTTDSGNTQVTGYQILKNGRAISKTIPIDKRRASIHDLDIGNRYSLQIVPITNQLGCNPFQLGEEYDPELHIYFLPGPKLDVDFTDLVQIPSKIWIENISGHSAVVCWSATENVSNKNALPDNYKLFIWNSKNQKRDQATVIQIPKDKISQDLKDLRPATTYEIQLEAFKKRSDPKTNETYIVSATSKILKFETGAPPDAPSNLKIIACTNTTIRIGFDPFIEHLAEIITLRVYCESISAKKNKHEVILDLTPDSTEFILPNLIERTHYNLTIYAITDEYLNEIHLHDISKLPNKLKSSYWLTNKSLLFTTSGCEPASQILISSATVQSIQLQWALPKAYGSTKFLRQTLRWKLQNEEIEKSVELDSNTIQATIPGILSFGQYKISLDSYFSIKINLEDESDEASRKEIRLTTIEITSVRFQLPGLSEKPEVYLTGYTTNAIDLTWNKPNTFSIIDHPEKLNENIKIHRNLLGYRVEINGKKYNTLNKDQYQCTLTECLPGEEYKVQLIVQTSIQSEYVNDIFIGENGKDDEPEETSSKKLRVRMLDNDDLLQSFQAKFEFHHHVTKENTTEERNEVKPLGKINVRWKASDLDNISHFILKWHSSKDLCVQQKIFHSKETSFTIDACDEKHFYVIEIIIVTNDGIRHQYQQLKMPIPGEPDSPKLWLVKTSDTSFVVEWSEPKSYGIPVIGFQLYIEGKQASDMIKVNLHRAEIPSNVNRTYEVNICAVTNNPQRKHSLMSQTLSVLTTPPTNSSQPTYYTSTSSSHSQKPLNRNITRSIPVQIESMNEDKLHLDWTAFIPMIDIAAYYVHYTCLNNGEVQTLRVSKRNRHAVIQDLRAGFTYTIMVVAVDVDSEIVYSSEKNTVQMSPPPNAPIVAIRERTHDHVTLEWRPAPSYGELAIVGYKVYINSRLVAILSHDQLTYTLTNGSACEEYIVYVQALSNDKNISSSMSRGVKFSWPGIKPGVFRRLDDGLSSTVVVAWGPPQLEDPTEKIIAYKILSENVTTHVVRLHGEYTANTYEATIYDLINGKYRVWLEIQSEHFCARARPITIGFGRLQNRRLFHSAKCFMKKRKRFRSTGTMTLAPTVRHIQYS